MKYLIIFILLALYMLVGCVTELNKGTKFHHLPTNDAKIAYGVASYYDYVLDSGWSSVGHYVCATRDFIRYSYVKATNVANGKSVVCKVTDYGPDASIFPERIIDLSSTAFNAISSTKMGIIEVSVEQL